MIYKSNIESTLNYEKCQDRNNKKLKYHGIKLRDLDPQPTMNNAIGVAAGLKGYAKQVLEKCLHFRKFHHIYVSQGLIAKELGCTRETVNRVLQKLDDMGFIAKKWNGVKTVCSYKVSNWFKKPEVIDALRGKYKFAFILCITLIQSAISSNITQLDSRSYLFINSSNSNSRHSTLEEQKYKKRDAKYMVEGGVVEKLKKWGLNFDPMQVKQLEMYDAELLERALERLKTKQGLTNREAYFQWLCKNDAIYTADRAAESNKSKKTASTAFTSRKTTLTPEQQANYDRLEAKKKQYVPPKWYGYSAVGMAKRIYELKALPVKYPKLQTEEQWNITRWGYIRDLLECNPNPTLDGSPGEDIALLTIKKTKEEVQNFFETQESINGGGSRATEPQDRSFAASLRQIIGSIKPDSIIKNDIVSSNNIDNKNNKDCAPLNFNPFSDMGD